MPSTDPRIDWSGLRGPGPIEGVRAATVHGAQLTAAFYSLKPGVVVPEHRHFNEEFGQVIRGSLELSHLGERHVLGAGDAFLVAGDVPHGARAGNDGCELLECYAPPRESGA